MAGKRQRLMRYCGAGCWVLQRVRGLLGWNEIVCFRGEYRVLCLIAVEDCSLLYLEKHGEYSGDM